MFHRAIIRGDMYAVERQGFETREECCVEFGTAFGTIYDDTQIFTGTLIWIDSVEKWYGLPSWKVLWGSR